MKVDRELLQVALAGYDLKLQAIEAKVQEIRRTLDGADAAVLGDIKLVPKKPMRRVVSAAGRRKMALAAKRRWAQRKAS